MAFSTSPTESKPPRTAIPRRLSLFSNNDRLECLRPTIIPHLREASNDADSLHPNFDPQRFPILAVHWFGIHQPTRPSAEVVDLNRIRLAGALVRFAIKTGRLERLKAAVRKGRFDG